jgi:hypothetical protein
MKRLSIQFESIVNSMQMKLMKVNLILKNRMIQEFQHFLEFQSIKAKSIHMLPIQVEPIVNSISMKSTNMRFIMSRWERAAFPVAAPGRIIQRPVWCPPPRPRLVMTGQVTWHLPEQEEPHGFTGMCA